jgi:hypothetical protein
LAPGSKINFQIHYKKNFEPGTECCLGPEYSRAQRTLAGCEACSEDAELPFEYFFDRLTVPNEMTASEELPRPFAD